MVPKSIQDHEHVVSRQSWPFEVSSVDFRRLAVIGSASDRGPGH